VNLYRGSARFVHLLRGVGIEVRNRERVADPFRRDVLQLNADNREDGRKQNATVSPDQNEIAHITDWRGRLKIGLRRGKGTCVAPGIGAVLRGDRLLDHDDLRLRRRLLHCLLVLLIVAQVIIGVGIAAKQNRDEGTLSAVAVVPEVRRVVAQCSANRRQVREIESQSGHA